MASGVSGNINQATNLGPKTAASTHPLYLLFRPVWELLAHVREGTGGFLDGQFLQAHPREWLDHTIKVTSQSTAVDGGVEDRWVVNPNPKQPSPKLLARRKLARYDNVASAILETKKSLLFREQPVRRVGASDGQDPTELEQWWQDVDGEDCHIDDAMPGWWDIAATFGHCGLYMDLGGPTDPQPMTAAEEAQPYVRVYTPLDILDWRRNDEGRLVWIKLLEATQAVPTTIDARTIITYRVRIVDDMSWRLYDYKTGRFIDTGDHNLGVVPFVWLFTKRRALLPDIGESVVGDPHNYLALYNCDSEVRELLRTQTFSVVNVALGTGDHATSVENAQAMIGQQTGSMNLLFTPGPAHMLSGEPQNVESYHKEIERIKRAIYRETGVRWETDSKDAEAKGSLQLKRDEMETRLAGYADECEQTEYALAKLWYRWRYGPDQAETKFENDLVQINYPDRFTQTPFQDVLDQGLAAQTLGMPSIFLKELRKALIAKFDGMANLSPEVLSEINDAIDNAPDDPTPQEKQRQKMALLAASVKPGGDRPPTFGGSNAADSTAA
jgi:hypothetical protein